MKYGFLLLAFLLCACRASETAEAIEKNILENTPYKKGIFDCTERATMGALLLEKEGFGTTFLIQRNKYTHGKHRCVAWVKGEERGTILCQKGDGWEYISFAD
jgi:hypothetical protein